MAIRKRKRERKRSINIEFKEYLWLIIKDTFILRLFENIPNNLLLPVPLTLITLLLNI